MLYDEFIDQLTSLFSDTKEEIMDEDSIGNITLQMGTFKRFTQKAIDENNLDLVEKCFQFISHNNYRVDDRVQNSIGITYLAKLSFSKYPEAERLLPENLKQIRDSLLKHYQTKSTNAAFNEFIEREKKRK